MDSEDSSADTPEPYPGAFVSLPWSDQYNPYDYELELQAWRHVVAAASSRVRAPPPPASPGQ